MSVEPDACSRCGHRAYDHDTDDGTCWKCPCESWVTPGGGSVGEGER